MKMGSMQGTPKEINNFFANNGLNISDYLEKPERPLKPIYFIAPVLFIIAGLAGLTLCTLNTGVRTFVFLLGCGAGFWEAVALQIRFKNAWISIFVAVGTVLLMLVALGVVQPLEMIQHLKDFTNKK